jgi:hypothetical protein
MVVNTSSELILFSFILSKLKCKRAVSRPFLVSLSTLISRLAFLTPITIEHVHAVTIRIMSFSSLRNHFYVLWAENITDVLPNEMHIRKLLIFEEVHINANFKLHLLLNHACIITHEFFN